MLETNNPRTPITIDFLKSIAFIKRVPLNIYAETLQDSIKLATHKPFIDVIEESYREFKSVLPSEVPGFLDQMKEKVFQIDMLNPDKSIKEPLGDFYPIYAVELAIDAVWFQLSINS